MPKKNNSNLSEEYLTQHARDKFASSKNWRDDKILERWKKSNNLYNSEFESGQKTQSDVLIGSGRLFIPKTYSHLQRILIDVLKTVIDDPEEIVDISPWKGVPLEQRKTVKTLLNYRLNGNPINFYQEMYEAVLDALKNKVGIFKVYPKIKTRKETVQVSKFPKMPLINFVQEDKEIDVLDYFAPILECLPYEDVFFDPRATWKDYWKYTIIHRMIKTKDYLKRRGYKNLDQVKNIKGSIISQDEIKEQRETNQGLKITWNDSPTKQDESVYVFEIWTLLDVNGDGLLESCKYYMAGDSNSPEIVISDIEENTLPYAHPGDDYNRPPILVGSAFPEAHQMYGKDLPEIVEGLQRETNAQRNQRREAVALSLRRPILVNRAANIDLMSLVNRRIGGVVLGDDIGSESVREMDINSVGLDTVQEQNKTEQDYYEATSVPPNLFGMPSNKDETATGVTSHVANANRKIEMVVLNLVNTLVIPALEMILRLEQVYESDEFIQQLTGTILGWGGENDNVPTMDSIQGGFNLKVNLGVNKQTQLNKYFLLMDRAIQANTATTQMVASGLVNPAEAKFINIMTLFKQALPILGEKNVEDYEIQAQPPPPPQAEGAPSPKGVASQPGAQDLNIENVVSNLNPEAITGVVNG